ncbi:hypothetical protein POX_c03900 [Penicillium oxalicum]|uniref:hypothetical protein n=1 Tax=Penicillium oxalicum TaxID=69781 RepID=UPI0020B85CDE|nr:hypothetical protein POX_c03900 [Penicillium oxalicum]KAI2791045.1 hypothetical protein POX_c03900 [Penicillium oxalicum]
MAQPSEDQTRYCADAEAHTSNHILSPQPSFHPMKESLVQSLETAHLPAYTDTSFHESRLSPNLSYDCSSSSSSNRHSISDISRHEMENDVEHINSRASSRSSVSSVPASVLLHPADQLEQFGSPGHHNQVAGYTVEEDEADFGGFDRSPQSMRTIRQREAAFRKPSSVRAMQMYTEDEADVDEFLSPPRRRQSVRSPGMSCTKRSSFYSPKTSHTKPASKKEYPLVLLHCTLLAPSLPVPGAAEPHYQKIVEEVLPSQYWKRWRRLQDKVGSGVLRERGVLISHPEDLYDVLEERLLESLELQRPIVHRGHFIGHEKAGAGSEEETSDRDDSETDGEQGDECPDCGGRVLHHSDVNRKWEIRVYAANGLMRAGAWAAAWKEMEKVDVEVGVWLPSDVRRALEKRLEEALPAVASQSIEIPLAPSDSVTPRMELPAAPFYSQSNVLKDIKPGANDMHHFNAGKSNVHPREPGSKANNEIPLRTLLFNYIRVLAADRRNIALAVMSVLVVFLTIGMRSQNDQIEHVLHAFSQDEPHAPSLIAQVNVVTAVPVLSTIDSDSSLMENLIPTSSVMLPMPIADSPVQLRAKQTFSSIPAAAPETLLVDSKPTVEMESPAATGIAMDVKPRIDASATPVVDSTEHAPLVDSTIDLEPTIASVVGTEFENIAENTGDADSIINAESTNLDEPSGLDTDVERTEFNKPTEPKISHQVFESVEAAEPAAESNSTGRDMESAVDAGLSITSEENSDSSLKAEKSASTESIISANADPRDEHVAEEADDSLSASDKIHLGSSEDESSKLGDPFEAICPAHLPILTHESTCPRLWEMKHE